MEKLESRGISVRKNTFTNDGIIIYEDRCGNSVFCQRENIDKKGTYDFKARVRFADKNVKADTIHISIPIEEGVEGQSLKLNYLDGRVHDGEDVAAAIEMYTFVLQRWIDLMYDISFLQTDVRVHAKALGLDDSKATLEEIAKAKLDQISEYEEISDAIGGILSIS
nr:hypothetical protein [uncultured Butyrivibrio sp.]